MLIKNNIGQGRIQYIVVIAMLVCVHAVRGCVFGLVYQIYFLLMNPWQYTFTHGFDITLDLLLMAWNFKDILRFLFFRIV